jgi:putative proteasome-type protease
VVFAAEGGEGGWAPMTYCVALRLNRGLVFAADTRTSAGSDNVAVFRKLHYWRKMGERVVVLTSAGNLAVTQSVISLLNEQLVEELSPGAESFFTVPSLYRAALLVGDALREVRRRDGAALEESGSSFNANFILGGQIGSEVPRLFHIYPEGNFIEATDDTPFFQIGEHKYGKPIIDRVAQPNMRLGEAAKLALLSFDSTLRSNLTVGLPIDLLIYERDTLDVRRQKRIEQDDAYFRSLSSAWSDALRSAFAKIEEFKL